MKTKKAFALVCAVLVSALSFSVASAELTAQPREHYEELTEAHVYKSPSGGSMPYRLFVPKNDDTKKQYPLLLSFHGAGSRGDDNLKHLRAWVAGWTVAGVQAKHPCIILMPQCPRGSQWVNTPWRKGSYSVSKLAMSKSMKLAKEIFDKILKEKSVDRSRIYVMGASMGGYGTWDFIMRHPDIVAAAAPVCGAGDPSMANALKNLPIWAFHGDKDRTVPFAGSKEMIDAIQKAGGQKAKLKVYKGVKHNSYGMAWKEPGLVEWMFSQKK